MDLAIAPTPTDERELLPSASGIDKLANCPGSFAAEQGLSPLPEQDVTKDGTNIHQALADGDDSNLPTTQREIAQHLANMEKRELETWISDFNLNTAEMKSVREHRFWLRDPKTLELLASAKPDVVYVQGQHALIVDFKSGFKDPSPSESNWQLRVQSIAIHQEYPYFEHIRSATAHSRLSSKFDATDYTLDDLRRVRRAFVDVLWRAKQPDAPRVPGPHCRYCKANGLCREKAVYDSIAASQLPVRSGKSDQMALIQAVGLLTPPELAHLWRRKSSMETAYNAIEFRMKSLPKDVLADLGYELAPGNKNKEITDVATAFQRLATVLTDDERMQCLNIVRGRTADKLAERTNISKKAAQEQIDQALGDVLIEKPGNPRLKEL